MADLLLELFSEEIPARMQAQAALDLVRLLGAALTQAGITATYVTYVTPRRLAVIAKGLPVMQADSSNERKGPKTTAPEAAIQGFLKSTGLALDQLEIRGDVYFACIQQKGRATSELLKEVIEKTLREFPWPKSMHWGAGDAIWVRPLHSILCLFDGAVVTE